MICLPCIAFVVIKVALVAAEGGVECRAEQHREEEEEEEEKGKQSYDRFRQPDAHSKP